MLIASLAAAADAEPTLADLRKELDILRGQVTAREGARPLDRKIEHIVDKARPNQALATKTGRLTIGGLIQVWAYSIQNDNQNWVDINQVNGPAGGGTAAVNETADNDSFRVRRAELNFTLDLSENIRSFVMIDPAREAVGFPSAPSNQGSGLPGDSDVLYFSPCLCDLPVAPPDSDPRGIHRGLGIANRLLQEAWIEYHGYVPHHDFRVGLMKRQLGEEGTRDSGHLDFAERAMITQMAEQRDIGAQVHGFWLDGRVDYWLGVFNGPGTAFQALGNRSDTEDAKDFTATVRVRPVKGHETWGTLELGYSILYGIGGEAAGHLPGTIPVNGMNRNETVRGMQYVWGSYRPGGPVRGWWLRGEWGQYRNRFAPAEAASGLAVTSFDPAPFSIQGWNVASGYKLSESAFDTMPRWLQGFEFTLRYDVMENLFFHDLLLAERRFDVFKTQVYTAGINYYILGQRAKLQLNYNWITEEDSGVDKEDRQLREVRNDTVILNFQLAF